MQEFLLSYHSIVVLTGNVAIPVQTNANDNLGLDAIILV